MTCGTPDVSYNRWTINASQLIAVSLHHGIDQALMCRRQAELIRAEVMLEQTFAHLYRGTFDQAYSVCHLPYRTSQMCGQLIKCRFGAMPSICFANIMILVAFSRIFSYFAPNWLTCSVNPLQHRNITELQ